MKTDINTKHENNLWQARQRSSLERKQVAFLLSKKSTDEISRYEKGLYLPNLKTALKLEIIYQMPIRLLFQALFEEYRREINEIRKQNVHSLPSIGWFPRKAEQLKQEEFCFYAELLKSHVPSVLEMEAIRKHALSLVNTASDYGQGREPFSGNSNNS